MADYGAMLTDVNGVAFYITDTLPLSLIEVKTLTLNLPGTYYGQAIAHADDGLPRVVFIQSSGGPTNAFYYTMANGNWYIRGTANAVVRVYIFGYKYQTPPKWGIAIWDANGNCVITNETKVLSGITNLGTEGQDSSGYKLDTTLVGSWAVAPAIDGMFIGVVGQPNPHTVQIPFATNAYYNGTTTRINSNATGTDSGPFLSTTYLNSNIRLQCINVARY